METIFGTGMPIAAKVVFALVIVIGLASAVFYMVRYVSASRLGGAGIRGRQPRLAVIEVAGVDPRRRLLLIRRDNVEHLIMIGGPTDVVVEPNIVRAVAVTGTRDTARDTASARMPSGSESLPRTDGGSRSPQAAEAAMWPLQPDTGSRQARPPKAEDGTWPPQSEPAARPNPTDPLAGLAAELGRIPPTQAQSENAASGRRDQKRGMPQAA